MSKKKPQTSNEIKKLQSFVIDRIEEIQSKIKNINIQLLTMEDILSDIKSKIDLCDTNDKYTNKSRLIRWYFEDVKIYNELNNIRISYEQLLQKYIDQQMSSHFKLEELEIKKQKLDEENENIQKILMELNEKLKENNNTDLVLEVQKEMPPEFNL